MRSLAPRTWRSLVILVSFSIPRALFAPAPDASGSTQPRGRACDAPHRGRPRRWHRHRWGRRTARRCAEARGTRRCTSINRENHPVPRSLSPTVPRRRSSRSARGGSGMHGASSPCAAQSPPCSTARRTPVSVIGDERRTNEATKKSHAAVANETKRLSNGGGMVGEWPSNGRVMVEEWSMNGRLIQRTPHATWQTVRKA